MTSHSVHSPSTDFCTGEAAYYYYRNELLLQRKLEVWGKSIFFSPLSETQAYQSMRRRLWGRVGHVLGKPLSKPIIANMDRDPTLPAALGGMDITVPILQIGKSRHEARGSQLLWVNSKRLLEWYNVVGESLGTGRIYSTGRELTRLPRL